MQISLLGPLVVDECGASLVPTAAKPRQVLALLAMQPGHLVTVPALMAELWGDRLPNSAVTTLQTYVLQLRRRLAAAHGGAADCAHRILATRPAGYVLDPDMIEHDATRFEKLAARGQAALRRGEIDTASATLSSALGQWRAAALVDVVTGPVLSIEATRLEQIRLSALESRLDADLRRGLHAAVIGELTALTARNPFHEGLHAQLMVALHRCGRPVDALGTFRRLRATLIAELGMEPSLRLQRVHQAMLAGRDDLDPALAS